jgi:hypothetical protein
MASRAAKTATAALTILWEDGFFKTWKKKSAIETELAKRGNYFNNAELGMALMRARHLTRRGKAGTYEYIQKYPYEVEAQERAKAGVKPHGRSTSTPR